MNFETYLDIMQNHGIGEMVFTFLGNEFCVEEEFNADGCGCLTFLLIMPKDREKTIASMIMRISMNLLRQKYLIAIL